MNFFEKSNMLRRLQALLLLVFCIAAMKAQLSGTGYYRFRNAANADDYIGMTNDLFNYHIVASNAGGGLRQLMTDAGKSRALACAGKYLQTDIHMINDEEDFIDPASVIYAKKKSAAVTNYEYNLIGQGTSLLTLTTGTYAGSVQLQFKDRYVTISKSSGSGANTLYVASVELKSATSVFLYGQPSLGTFYFVDNNKTFAINSSSSADNAKWYIEPVTNFKVKPMVSYNGKYYTTMYTAFPYILSGQVLNAYAVTAIGADGFMEVGNPVATNGGTVPAGTPVILECGTDVASECLLIPTGEPICTEPNVSVTSGGAPRASTATNYSSTNLLKGNYYCNTDGNISYATNGSTSSFNANHYTARTNSMYTLGITASGRLGFVKVPTDVTAMPANKAWIEYSGTAELILPFEPETIPGDVTGNGILSKTDIEAAARIILGFTEGMDEDGNQVTYNQEAADADGENGVTLRDLTLLVNLLKGK